MSKKPRVREDSVFREVGGEWVVYTPEGRRLHALNLTGALVWSLCDGEHDVDAMVAELRSALASTPEPDVVRADVERILRELREAELLA